MRPSVKELKKTMSTSASCSFTPAHAILMSWNSDTTPITLSGVDRNSIGGDDPSSPVPGVSVAKMIWSFTITTGHPKQLGLIWPAYSNNNCLPLLHGDRCRKSLNEQILTV